VISARFQKDTEVCHYSSSRPSPPHTRRTPAPATMQPAPRSSCRRLLEPFAAPASLLPAPLGRSRGDLPAVIRALLRLVPRLLQFQSCLLGGEFIAVRLSQVVFPSSLCARLPSCLCSLVAFEIRSVANPPWRYNLFSMCSNVA
jgi:hypothetical protein